MKVTVKATAKVLRGWESITAVNLDRRLPRSFTKHYANIVAAKGKANSAEPLSSVIYLCVCMALICLLLNGIEHNITEQSKIEANKTKQS